MPDSHDLTDSVLVALRQIMRAVDLHSRQLVHKHGITGPQALVLKTLLSARELPIGELARHVNLSQATITDIVDRLEKRRLATRERSSTDRRRVLVRPTAAAGELLRESFPLLQENFVAEFRKLHDWEQTLILSSLQRVAEMMNAQRLEVAPVLFADTLTRSAEDETAPAA